VEEKTKTQKNAFTSFYVAAGVVWARESRKNWLDSNHSYLYNIMFDFWHSLNGILSQFFFPLGWWFF
jgi:hypothetical protein